MFIVDQINHVKKRNNMKEYSMKQVNPKWKKRDQNKDQKEKWKNKVLIKCFIHQEGLRLIFWMSNWMIQSLPKRTKTNRPLKKICSNGWFDIQKIKFGKLTSKEMNIFEKTMEDSWNAMKESLDETSTKTSVFFIRLHKNENKKNNQFEM